MLQLGPELDGIVLEHYRARQAREIETDVVHLGEADVVVGAPSPSPPNLHQRYQHQWNLHGLLPVGQGTVSTLEGGPKVSYRILPSAEGMMNTARLLGLNPGSDTFGFESSDQGGKFPASVYLSYLSRGVVPWADKSPSYAVHDRRADDHGFGWLCSPVVLFEAIKLAANRADSQEEAAELTKAVDRVSSLVSDVVSFILDGRLGDFVSGSFDDSRTVKTVFEMAGMSTAFCTSRTIHGARQRAFGIKRKLETLRPNPHSSAFRRYGRLATVWLLIN